jgi:two-component system phosphate regulon sensor histidine kinase PhoR
MRRLSQGTLLALANAALVLLTVAALAGTGALLVRHLLAEQVRERSASAAATASRELAAASARLEVAARLLGERPTVQRLGSSGRRRELSAFLVRYRETSGLAGAAVLRDGKPWAASDEPPALLLEPPEATRWLAAEGPELPLVLAARVSTEEEGVEVLLWQRLDERFAAALSGQVGVPVRLVAADAPRLGAPSPARAEVPLPSALGLAGRIEAEPPAEALLEPLRRLLRGYALAACAAAALALAAGLLLGRRFGAPARLLGQAASRIGAGDLRTPVPAAWGGEMGQLGATLEDMRHRLLDLTNELARRDAESRAVLGGILEGVVAVDDDRRVTYLNPAAEALLGVAVDGARGRFCGDLLRPEPEGGAPPCQDRCPIVHARGRGTVRTLERVRPTGGPARAVVVSCSPPEAGSQVLVLRDESEAEAGRRVREAILANLSHELKTPLAAQLASVELLQDGLGSKIPLAEASRLVAALERSTVRLMGLVDNLLTSSRLEAGEWGMRVESVDLAEVAREAAAVLGALFAQRGQALEWNLAEMPPVSGDRTQLLQVVLNLLGNANKFAPEGSVVRVGCRREGEQAATLWVEDEGPGLPPGAESTLFERFRRAPGLAPRGVGLGLWIVRAVVERHGGTVSASTARGGGACFTVVLPLPPQPEVTAA